MNFKILFQGFMDTITIHVVFPQNVWEERFDAFVIFCHVMLIFTIIASVTLFLRQPSYLDG